MIVCWYIPKIATRIFLLIPALIFGNCPINKQNKSKFHQISFITFNEQIMQKRYSYNTVQNFLMRLNYVKHGIHSLLMIFNRSEY